MRSIDCGNEYKQMVKARRKGLASEAQSVCRKYRVRYRMLCICRCALMGLAFKLTQDSYIHNKDMDKRCGPTLSFFYHDHSALISLGVVKWFA